MSSTFRRARGFTLIETLVALSLLFLLLGSLVGLMIYAFASLRQLTAYNNVQQQLNFAVRALVTDLELSDANGMDTTNPGSCTFISPLDLQTAPNNQVFTYDTTNLAYKTWVCYYLSTNGQLTRAEQSMGGNFVISAIPVATRPALTTFSAIASPPALVVARQVQQFLIAPAPIPNVVQLSLQVGQQVDSTHTTQLNVVTQVKLRN